MEFPSKIITEINNKKNEKNNDENKDIILIEKINRLENDILNLKRGNEIIINENNDIKGKYESVKADNEKILKENKDIKQKLTEVNKAFKSYKSKNEQKINELNNKIELCEIKLNMISYRDFIKNIIIYCHQYFNCSYTNNDNNLYTKVIDLKNELNRSSNDSILSEHERLILSNFIFISYITSKNVSQNVHSGSFGLNLTLSNYIKCQQEYIQIYELDIMNKSLLYLKKDFELKRYVFNVNNIKTILEKINYNYFDSY